MADHLFSPKMTKKKQRALRRESYMYGQICKLPRAPNRPATLIMPLPPLLCLFEFRNGRLILSLCTKDMHSANLLGLLLRLVRAVICALDLFNHHVNSFSLLVPFVLAHFEFLLEELVVGLAVAAAEAVPEGGELAVVVVEVEVVHGVAGGAVYDGRVVGIFAVVDQDGPDVDEDEEGDAGDFGEREQEWEDVVGEALGVAVGGVEGVRGERRGHDPLVVWLVDVLVDAGVVQAAVNPVDAQVGEADEEGNLGVVIPSSRAVFGAVVELGVSAHLGQEPGNSEDGHDGEGDVGLLHLKLDLMFEVSRVVEGGLVEDKEVGCAGEDVVDKETKEPGLDIRRIVNVYTPVSTHQVMRYKVRACLFQSSRGHWLM